MKTLTIQWLLSLSFNFWLYSVCKSFTSDGVLKCYSLDLITPTCLFLMHATYCSGLYFTNDIFMTLLLCQAVCIMGNTNETNSDHCSCWAHRTVRAALEGCVWALNVSSWSSPQALTQASAVFWPLNKKSLSPCLAVGALEAKTLLYGLSAVRTLTLGPITFLASFSRKMPARCLDAVRSQLQSLACIGGKIC